MEHKVTKRISRELQRISPEKILRAKYLTSKNFLEGYAIIKGAPDSPYEGGFYIIKFSFPNPSDQSGKHYPFVPPICKYLTNCPHRQNPNLYENGKVCLSLINTWNTEDNRQEGGWKPSKNIEQVIISIQGNCFVSNALDCEPEYDYSIHFPKMTANYDKIVQYLNFKYNILDLYLNPPVPQQYVEEVRSYIREHINQNKTWYVKTLDFLSKTIKKTTLSCSKYSTTKTVNIDYPQLTRKLASVF